MARPFIASWRNHVASSALTTTQRAIAWRAADYANPEGSRCYPSALRLAQECGLMVAPGETRNKAVERAFAALVRCGLAVRVSGGHRGAAAHYKLVIPGEGKGDSTDPQSRERGTDGSHKGGLPSPPTNPDHGGAADAARRRPRHGFRDDGSGQSCEVCQLGPNHGSHRPRREAS